MGEFALQTVTISVHFINMKTLFSHLLLFLSTLLKIHEWSSLLYGFFGTSCQSYRTNHAILHNNFNSKGWLQSAMLTTNLLKKYQKDGSATFQLPLSFILIFLYAWSLSNCSHALTVRVARSSLGRVVDCPPSRPNRTSTAKEQVLPHPNNLNPSLKADFP